MTAAALTLVLGWLKGLGSAVLQALADWRVLAVAAAVLALLWGLHETRRADGLAATLKVEQGALTQEHAAFLAEQAHAAAVQAARGQDHAAAVTNADDQARACEARVSAARRSATAIHQLLNEPAHATPDPSEPELLSGDRLWSAIGGR